MLYRKLHIQTLLYTILLLVLMVACLSENDRDTETGIVVTNNNVTVHSNLSIQSSVLDQTIKYDIILPPSFTTNPEKSYPILYLLHGMGDNNNAWITKGSAKILVQYAIKIGVIPEMIVVMPDALVTFYVNGFQSGLKYDTFFQEEFIPYIESEYRVQATRSNRFIAGLSMGGFGASYHAFTYPDRFSYCYSMSGALEGVSSEATPSIAKLIAGYGGDFSSLPGYTIDCGTSDFLVYGSNVNTHNALMQLGFTHEYIARNGSHDWTFWQESLQIALERIGQRLL